MWIGRGETDDAYDAVISFEFILILHFIKEIIGINNILCQDLHQKIFKMFQMHLVKSTKLLF